MDFEIYKEKVKLVANALANTAVGFFIGAIITVFIPFVLKGADVTNSGLEFFNVFIAFAWCVILGIVFLFFAYLILDKLRNGGDNAK